MKVLLDECLPRKLKRFLPGHQVSTVPEMGWASIKNGALLRLAEPVFEVFVTIDGNLQHQQDLRATSLAVIVLSAPDNTLETLHPLMREVVAALERDLTPGSVTRVGTGER
jgi:predicted nuclease of predicted toxin-antitoxin system